MYCITLALLSFFAGINHSLTLTVEHRWRRREITDSNTSVHMIHIALADFLGTNALIYIIVDHVEHVAKVLSAECAREHGRNSQVTDRNGIPASYSWELHSSYIRYL